MKTPVSHSREPVFQGPHSVFGSNADNDSNRKLSCLLSDFDKCSLLNGGDNFYQNLENPLGIFKINQTPMYPAKNQTSATSDMRPSINDITYDEYDEWIEGFNPSREEVDQPKHKLLFPKSVHNIPAEKIVLKYNPLVGFDEPPAKRLNSCKPFDTLLITK